MQRNMNCVRDIMQKIESRYTRITGECMLWPKEFLPTWSEQEVKCHLAIMAGPFIRWTFYRFEQQYEITLITDLGLDFLAASRDDRTWYMALHAADDTMNFETFTALLKKTASERALDKDKDIPLDGSCSC